MNQILLIFSKDIKLKPFFVHTDRTLKLNGKIDSWELERVLGATLPENFGITPSQYMD